MDATTPTKRVENISIPNERMISRVDTVPMDTLTNMDIKELKGIKEVIFSSRPSVLYIPITATANTAINMIVMGVELCLSRFSRPRRQGLHR